jgi:hypothetical protein
MYRRQEKNRTKCESAVEQVDAFDAVFDHILHMADVLSTGIIKQFPEKFRST